MPRSALSHLPYELFLGSNGDGVSKEAAHSSVQDEGRDVATLARRTLSEEKLKSITSRKAGQF